VPSWHLLVLHGAQLLGAGFWGWLLPVLPTLLGVLSSMDSALFALPSLASNHRVWLLS
jgi:hypothetical protein